MIDRHFGGVDGNTSAAAVRPWQSVIGTDIARIPNESRSSLLAQPCRRTWGKTSDNSSSVRLSRALSVESEGLTKHDVIHRRTASSTSPIDVLRADYGFQRSPSWKGSSGYPRDINSVRTIKLGNRMIDRRL